MNIDNRKKDLIYHILYVVIMSVIVTGAIIMILTASLEEPKPVKVGCVFSGGIGDQGWNSENYIGVSAACETDLLDLAVRENVPEDEMSCISAVSSLAAENCGVVFLVSYGYEKYADKLMSLYPDIEFCVTGSETMDERFTYYLGRLYEGRYLTGIIAGLTTKTNTIGYVASMPNNEVNRGINAFTLGVRKVNPDACVKVIFTGAWDAPEKERNAVKTLAGLSVDVISYHQNREDVPDTCEELGIDFIGCYDPEKSYSEHLLTSIECKWENVYRSILRDIRNTRGPKEDIYWLGISEDTIELTEFSENVSLRARYEVNFAMNDIAAGNNVFTGEIYDNNGVLRCAEGEALSDRNLFFGMDWYAEGVEIYEA